MAIFNNNNNDDALTVAGLIAAAPPVNQELLEKLTDLADMLDDAFAMPNLTGAGDRAIIYFMSAVTLSLDSITDAVEVETQLADVSEEIAAFGAAPPGGIDENWWDTFHTTLNAARNALL
jgi:hypothetical protein